MKSGTQETMKFKRLQRRLGLPMWQAIGLLESIWQLTARSAPRGDIGKHSNDDIAAWLEYSGDENDLIAALVESGWLDECSTHRLVVHDWSEHAPNFVKGNVARHLGGFATVLKGPSPGDTPRDRPNDSPNGIVPPSLAKPSQAKPSQAKPINVSDSNGIPRKRFKKPTQAELEAYALEKSLQIDAEAFLAYYESNGWKVGRNPMKCWKSAATGWARRNMGGQGDPPAVVQI